MISSIWIRRCVPIREVSSFQRVVCTGFNGVGTCRCVPIREVSSFQRVVLSSPLLPPLRDVLFTHFESVEEGTRNVVAECVGKLTLVDPHTLLSKLQASHPTLSL